MHARHTVHAAGWVGSRDSGPSEAVKARTAGKESAQKVKCVRLRHNIEEWQGRPSPGADVGGVGTVPVRMWEG